MLGGTQSLHTNSFDEALALPTEHAARIALRTQQVIAYESGAASTVDPLAGSWFVEALTNRLEAEARDYSARIDELGGVVAAIEQNFFQREIAEAAFRFQSEVESDERVIVGVNRYELRDEAEPELLRVDPPSSPSRWGGCRRCAPAGIRPRSRRRSHACERPRRATRTSCRC